MIFMIYLMIFNNKYLFNDIILSLNILSYLMQNQLCSDKKKNNNWDSEKLTDVSKVTWLVVGGVQIQVPLVRKDMHSFTPLSGVPSKE